jgi:uncharacterized protein (TIGR00299 family) protein
MTKITLIDSQTAGISGDMLLGAFIDAGANTKNIQQVLDLIPQHYPKCKSLRLETREVMKHGFRTCGIAFKISEEGQETEAQELINATREITNASNLSDRAKSFAASSIRILVDVESKLHGVEISRTHLHETGSADTLADVFGVAAACDSLEVFEGEVYSTPVAVGGGSVSFSHGTLATPAPAVLEIASQSGMPIIGGPEAQELATPTGVSMLASLTKKFLETYPPMIPERVGYGAGKRELAKTPNLLRVVLGRRADQGPGSDIIQILETNLDDLPGEILGHTLQRLLDSGAKDAWITPAQFKKNRPGHVLHAICDPHDAQKLSEVMMREAGTLGVRYQEWRRFTLQREVKTIKVEIAGKTFDVRVKFGRDGSGRILRVKPEFDDVNSIAQVLSIPAREISEIVIHEAKRIIDRGNVGS